MSKPSSGHFKGTTGGHFAPNYQFTNELRNAIIKKDGLDLREHPTKYKQLSSKKLKLLRKKKLNRTITKSEYNHLEWQRRLNNRRNKAIIDFWKNEKRRIISKLPTTRNWSATQQQYILSDKRPKYAGKSIVSHHTYSVAKYPHLANRSELIYPATQYEHIYRWHGGNTRKSLPGIPINPLKEQF